MTPAVSAGACAHGSPTGSDGIPGGPSHDGIALEHVPSRFRTHPSYVKRTVFKLAGREVTDGSSWIRPPPEFHREPSQLDEWDVCPAWTAWAAAHFGELEPAGLWWDPFDDLDPSELTDDGRSVDVDGYQWGGADFLPFEDVEESCSPSAEDLAWHREDLELRRSAEPLYDVSAEVISTESNHPKHPLTCDNCGDQSQIVLDHCGVALCLPCWRKESRRAFPQIGRTIVTFLKLADPHLPLSKPCDRDGHRHDEQHPDLLELALRLRDLGIRPIVRFVTLTIRGGSELAERLHILLAAWSRLRETRFYRERSLGEIAKIEVTWSEIEGWHVHLHVAEVGRFLRDRPYGPFEEPRLVPRARPLKHVPRIEQLPEFYRYTFPHRVPEFLREYEPESNLKDEWIRATRGEGSIVDVRTANIREDPLAFAAELAKYVSKPFAGRADGSRLDLKDWPENVRLELARFVRGSIRVRWYCPAHSTMDHPSTRRRAPWEVGGGCPPDLYRCVTEDGREGEYRLESVGARRLRFYGCLRTIHAEIREDKHAEEEERLCGKCGKGSLLAPWEVARRLVAGWTLPPGAVWPLPSIHAHKSRNRRFGVRPFDSSPRWTGQAGEGAEGPPTRSGFDLALQEEGLRL